ncbi:MAG TPA: hypothetical protein VLA58_04250, partial [Chitinophagaceae bacterium]|nr:hypothetical protein [Chitinophagaceae bacterium]
GFLGRGFLGRGFLGRGFLGRGFLGRGFLGRGFLGGGFLGGGGGRGEGTGTTYESPVYHHCYAAGGPGCLDPKHHRHPPGDQLQQKRLPGGNADLGY